MSTHTVELQLEAARYADAEQVATLRESAERFAQLALEARGKTLGPLAARVDNPLIRLPGATPEEDGFRIPTPDETAEPDQYLVAWTWEVHG